MFRGAKKRTFRFGKKNVSFPKVETFRFADYTVVTSDGLDKLSGLIRQGDLSALQQTIERAVLLTNSSSLGADDFYIEKTASASRPVTLEEMEKLFISEVLREKNGNLTLCAQQLDISRQTLYNKIRKYGL